jgi:hypothetical protein
MGDTDQHCEVGVQHFLKRGARPTWPPSDTWLPATPGWAYASWRCARASHCARALLGCRAELLEPPVGSRSTGLHSCNLGSFAASAGLLAGAPSSAFWLAVVVHPPPCFSSFHTLLASRPLGEIGGVEFTRCVHLSLFQNRASSRTRGKTLRGGLRHSRQRLRVCTILRGVAFVVAGM